MSTINSYLLLQCLNHKGKDKKHKYGTLYQYDAKANCVLKHSVVSSLDERYSFRIKYSNAARISG